MGKKNIMDPRTVPHTIYDESRKENNCPYPVSLQELTGFYTVMYVLLPTHPQASFLSLSQARAHPNEWALLYAGAEMGAAPECVP